MRSVVATWVGVLGVLVLLSASNAYAIPDFFPRIPNAAKVAELSGGSGLTNGNCLVCHASTALQSFSNLNAFGKSFEAANGGDAASTPDSARTSQGSAHDTWTWSSAVASVDADNDTFTNGEELQDPAGDFNEGDAAPGQLALVTIPASSASKPPVVDASFAGGADPNRTDVSVEEKSAPSGLTFSIVATGSSSVVGISPSDTWLKPGSATTTGGSLIVDPNGLAPGSYDATASISQGGVYRSDTLFVHLQVTPLCGNGRPDAGEACDPGADVPNDCCTASCQFATGGTQCGAAPQGECDLPDTCSNDGICQLVFVTDGTPCTLEGCGLTSCQSGVCKENAAVCGNGLHECSEQCEIGDTCCTDHCTYASAETVCRAASGACGVADTCTGVGTTCPEQHQVKPSTSLCRPANAGGCDVAEFCDGVTDQCPVDGVQPATHVCRSAASACDAPEFCDGRTNGGCPANGFLPEGTYCSETQVCASGGLCVVPEPQPQSKEQVGCLQKWNAAAASAGSAVAKQASGCFAKGVKGKLSAGLDACIEPSSKTSGVISKADHSARAKCAKVEEPGFGTSDTADLEELTSEAVAEAYHDVFGPDLDAVVPADSASAAQCQAAISKNFAKCIAGRFTSFSTCVKKGLKGKDAQIESFVGVQDCLGFESNSTHLACSLNTTSRTTKALDKKCADDSASLTAAFPGCLAHGGGGEDEVLDRAELYGCLDRASKCRTCQALKTWGNLATNCDNFDDGLPNGSCP